MAMWALACGVSCLREKPESRPLVPPVSQSENSETKSVEPRKVTAQKAVEPARKAPKLIVFTDATCPHCRDFFDSTLLPLKKLVEGGTKEFTLDTRQLPEPASEYSMRAAKISKIAEQKGADSEFFSFLYDAANRSEFVTSEGLSMIAPLLGMTVETLEAELVKEETFQSLLKDGDLSEKYEVNSLPVTILLDGDSGKVIEVFQGKTGLQPILRAVRKA